MTQIAHVDGSCVPNPGPGGWAVVFDFGNGGTAELSGGENPSTNNRMELMASIMAIEKASKAEPLTLITDSQYVKQGITTWISSWKRKGWKTSFGEPVKNQDLWQRLDAAVQAHGRIEWKWVKGHSGNPGNDRADRLANAAARGESLTFPAPAGLPAAAAPAAPACPVAAFAQPDPELRSEDGPDPHSSSCSFAFDSNVFFVYDMSPIDHNWSMLRSVEETRLEIERKGAFIDDWMPDDRAGAPANRGFEEMQRFMAYWDRAQQAAMAQGWEGDFRGRPFVMWVPSYDRCDLVPAFVWKQDNNGTTFVVSPVELPHLVGA